MSADLKPILLLLAAAGFAGLAGAVLAQPAPAPASMVGVPQTAASAAMPASAAMTVTPAFRDLASKAPTLAQLAELQSKELQAVMAERLSKLNGTAKPANAASAPGDAASAPVRRVVVVKPKPAAPADTSKRVLSVYGPTGSETVEIRTPSGAVVAVKVGEAGPGFKVVSVTSAGVAIESFERANGAAVRIPVGSSFR